MRRSTLLLEDCGECADGDARAVCGEGGQGSGVEETFDKRAIYCIVVCAYYRTSTGGLLQ